MEVTQETTRSQMELWFFRDLSDDQRLALIRLAFNPDIARDAGKTQHNQRLCLRVILDRAAATALAERDAELAATKAELARMREALERIKAHAIKLRNGTDDWFELVEFEAWASRALTGDRT